MTAPDDHRAPARVFVVTPVLNGAPVITDTIRSVVGQTAVQSGRVALDYVVADGGSTDGTVDAAEAVAGGRVAVRSQPDGGLYDALADAWSARPDDTAVMAYLNAGDLWHPTALDVVLDVMEATGAPWICGQRLLYNAAGQPTYVALPFRYRPRLIAAGYYGGSLPHIQQESTFWSGALMAGVDLDVLRQFRLAGDHYLWTRFAEQAEPCIVESLLGGFRCHAGQLSAQTEDYRREALQTSRPPTLADRLLASWDALVWQAPPGIKKRFNARHLFRYDHAAGTWS